jgi:redox-sensitive bicupin YhaK (pirin superfamily)
MPIAQSLPGQKRDLGGFSVSRILPQSARRSVGPFVFYDALGPAWFEAGTGIDVRPHPHIGLATITWLFEGALTHRDSLGHVRDIEPGAVNWMTAGRGIVHSERTPPALRQTGHRMHALQSWVALPVSHQEQPPAFVHHPADALPRLHQTGITLTVIAGEMFGLASPVTFPHPIHYAELRMAAGSSLSLPVEWGERAVYPVSGALHLDDAPLTPGTMAILEENKPARLSASEAAVAMLLGGQPHPEPRHLEWNFVHHDPDRIKLAVEDWRQGRFAKVPGEDEFIPY